MINNGAPLLCISLAGGVSSFRPNCDVVVMHCGADRCVQVELPRHIMYSQTTTTQFCEP